MLMLLVGTVLLAWALSLRALAAWFSLWVSFWACVWSGVLRLSGSSAVPPGPAAAAGATQDPQPASQQQQQQQCSHPVKERVLALLPAQEPGEHVQSWVQQSAALLDAAPVELSPAASTCPSVSSTHTHHQQEQQQQHLQHSKDQQQQPQQPFFLESSSNGGSSSSAASTAQVISSIAQVAGQHMLAALLEQGTDAVPAAAGVWAASVLLAKCISEPGGIGCAGAGQSKVRRSSVGMCPPPLEFEASEELQRELEAAAPDAFLCPIGRVLMTDPVFTFPVGLTYHRPCLMAYISRTGRDPAQDTSPLSPSQLCPNVNLRDQIATWLQRQGVET